MSPKNDPNLFLKNLGRVIILLGTLFLAGLIALILIFLLSPVLLTGFMVISFIVSLVLLLGAIFVFAGLIWYLARKEPELGKSQNYSIKQSKEIK